MSKHERGRPAAKSPAPPEMTATTEAPQAPTAPPLTNVTPPPIVIALSRAMQRKWGVPVWLSVLAVFTGSNYHKNMLGTHNAHGIRATGTMHKNAEGWAWFGKLPFSYDQFGYACHKLALDYSDPKACADALAEVCPNIGNADFKLFKEIQ